MGKSGRRIWTIAALSVTLLLALSAATTAEAGILDDIPHIKGKLRTDGTLTVGEQETLTISKLRGTSTLRGKLKLNAYVSPPPTAAECTDFSLQSYCEYEPLFRVPGSPRFRPSRKGRATLTFVMPPGVEFTSFKDPLKSHPVYFANGETVEVEVEATIKRRTPHGTAFIVFPVASANAVVEVPAAPAPSS